MVPPGGKVPVKVTLLVGIVDPSEYRRKEYLERSMLEADPLYSSIYFSLPTFPSIYSDMKKPPGTEEPALAFTEAQLKVLGVTVTLAGAVELSSV
jgi:hypothetical protein